MATTMNLTGRLVAVGSVCGRRRVLMTFADRQRSLGSTMTCGCDSPGCLAIVCVGSVAQEDFDALPVEEQAAIYCSLCASNHAHVFSVRLEAMRIVGLGAESRALAAWRSFGDIGRESWAEAEASIRTGEVR